MLFSLDRSIQLELIQRFENEAGTLSAKERELVRVVEVAQVNKHVGSYHAPPSEFVSRWPPALPHIDRNVATFVEDLVQWGSVYHQVFDDCKHTRSLRFNDDSVAIFEVALMACKNH